MSDSPVFIQLLGDSFAKRFSVYLHGTSSNQFSLNCLPSISIPGAKVLDLKLHLKAVGSCLDPSITTVILVGCNDIKQGLHLQNFKNQFLSLIKYIHRLHPHMGLLIVQLPIYPVFSTNPLIVQQIIVINKFLSTLR